MPLECLKYNQALDRGRQRLPNDYNKAKKDLPPFLKGLNKELFFLSSLLHEQVATAHKIPRFPSVTHVFTAFSQLSASFSKGKIEFR